MVLLVTPAFRSGCNGCEVTAEVIITMAALTSAYTLLGMWLYRVVVQLGKDDVYGVRTELIQVFYDCLLAQFDRRQSSVARHGSHVKHR